jgi:diguanylate cyclase (GGDEF)-like protein
MILRLLRDCPIIAKACAASIVLTLCVVAVGANAFVALKDAAVGGAELSATSLSKQNAVSGVTHDVTTTHIKVFRYVTWASNGVSVRLLGALSAEIRFDLDVLKDRIACLALLPGLLAAERANLDTLADRWEKYQQTVRDTLDLVGGDTPTATMMLSAPDADFQKVAAELQRLSTVVTERTGVISRELASRAERNKHLLAVGGIAGVLVGMLATAFVAGCIAEPIRSVTRAMSQIARGKTDVEIGYSNRHDEVGQMVEAVAAFRRNIDEQNRLLRMREEELSVRNLRFDAALNNMSAGLCLFDAEQRLIACNSRYVEMYGLDAGRIRPGMTLHEILAMRCEAGSCRRMSREELLTWNDAISAGNEVRHSIVELRDGRICEIHRRPMADGGWVATHEDITERQMLNVRLEHNLTLLSERTALLQAVIDNFPGGIGFLDRDLRVVICNDRAKAILDLPQRLFDGGPPYLEDLLRFNALRGEYGPGDVETQVASKLALARDRTTYHFERERPDGTVLDVRGIPIDNGGFLTTYMDITEHHRSEAKIRHMARHDALTGLANRVLLDEHLEQALAAVAAGEMVAVHLLDLDRFKAVNDTLGHPSGDRLLQMVAQRLRALARETDIIVRMGGDEFAIVQLAVAEAADAASLARRCIAAVGHPYDIDGRQVVVGTSIGIALGPTDGMSPEELIKNADLALYAAKRDGRGTLAYFRPEMDAQMRARHAMQIDLRKGLAAGEFELYYEPMVDLDSGAIGGFEALLRWHHPRDGLLSPEAFMPLAEEIGLMVAIGEWTIREACATAARWPRRRRVAVNLSPAQFRSSGLLQAVIGALARSGLPADRLELEVNERVLWDDAAGVLGILRQLRGLGVRIAMDNFGTGHSSLSYLQSFPFDRIKIDRTFVADAAAGAGATNIIGAIAGLARCLGMATTVEGIESPAQRAAVKVEGCTEVQGLLLGQPVPAAAIERLADCLQGGGQADPAAA